jgi:SAM-dependent methyltransferase
LNDAWKNKGSRDAFKKQFELNRQQITLLPHEYPHHWKHFLKCIDTIGEENIGKVVDVGCGVGCYRQLLRKHHPEVAYVGLDYSEDAIRYAKYAWHEQVDMSFKVMDYRDLTPSYFKKGDVLVANALCDVLPEGDKVLSFLLDLGVDYYIIERVRTTEKSDSFFTEYVAYGEIRTCEFHHSIDDIRKIRERDIYRIVDVDDTYDLEENLIHIFIERMK